MSADPKVHLNVIFFIHLQTIYVHNLKRDELVNIRQQKQQNSCREKLLITHKLHQAATSGVTLEVQTFGKRSL